MFKITGQLVLAALLLVGANVYAHEGFELGIGAGTTHSLTPDTFKDAAKTGDANLYWIGYGFDENLGVEISHESFDFDGANTKHKAYGVSGVYNFIPQYKVHPLAKLGAGLLKTEVDGLDAVNSFDAKAALGVEANFSYVTVGALFNYIYMKKIADANPTMDAVENATALIPSLFLTIHGKRYAEKASAPVAPVAVAPMKKADADNDGVADEDDKCPNTAAGLAVNGFGCAITEKASVKLNVEFASGKTTLDSKFDDEIKTFADFMAKYPNTKVEIGGHTDNVGKAASNTSLSLKRANAVKAALVKAGVDAKRITAKGYGSSQPVADNKTAEGRQSNRRVMAEVTTVTEVKK